MYTVIYAGLRGIFLCRDVADFNVIMCVSSCHLMNFAFFGVFQYIGENKILVAG